MPEITPLEINPPSGEKPPNCNPPEMNPSGWCAYPGDKGGGLSPGYAHQPGGVHLRGLQFGVFLRGVNLQGVFSAHPCSAHVLCFYPKTGFWPSYCQISTDLDKILLYGIHLRAADLDRDRRVGGSRPNQNDYVFVILVTHPKSYIETTDRRDLGGKLSEWRCMRTGAIVKNSGIL